MTRVAYTDLEAALIFVTAYWKYGIKYPPSDQLVKERPRCPWLEPVIKRHGPDSVEAKWNDFRSHLLPGHVRKRGVTDQVRRISHELAWIRQPHGIPFMDMLARLARGTTANRRGGGLTLTESGGESQ